MKRLSIALVFLLCCAQREHAPTQYEKDGIRFSVPSTCNVASDKYLNEKHTGRAIQVECANNALFSIVTIPASSSETLELFASHVAARRADAIKEKFAVLGHETPTASDTAQTTIHGADTQGVRQRFSIELLGQQVPHIAEFYLLPTAKWKVIFMTQVAETHLDESRPRWKAIFDSVEVE